MIRGGRGRDNLRMATPKMIEDEALGRLRDGLHRIKLRDGRSALAKVRRGAPAGFFDAEARGLAALREARALRVPDVFAVQAHAILIEDLGSGRPRRDDWERAGTHLAGMHRLVVETFGFDADGWCGDSPQDNTRSIDGHSFFVERRLRAQAKRARANGLLDENDSRHLD